MFIITWVKRLLGLTTAKGSGPVPTGPGSGHSRPSTTAADVGRRVREPPKADAQWSEIWQALNPDGEAHARSRGPVPSLTAADVGRRVQELQRANAQWPEIWQALNPDGDAEAQQLLVEFRGPYLFAPHVALNVLQEGCRRALACSPGADRAAALRAALQSDDRVVRPH
jgi:hypothetical protein